MSEYERLKEMVAKLRAKERSSGERRTLRGGDATARLSSLITEVNETILPRRLMLLWDEGPGIQLAVANRRLQGILSPSVDVLKPHFNKPLSAPDDDITESVKLALLTALETAQSATIKTRHLGDNDLGSDAGIAAETLSRHWGLAAPQGGGAASSDALPAFFEGLNGVASAWLSVENEEVVAQDGTDEDLAQLGDMAAYLLDAYLNRKETLFSSNEMPRCFAVSGADKGVFFGDTGTQTVFVISKPSDMIRVAALWQRSFG